MCECYSEPGLQLALSTPWKRPIHRKRVCKGSALDSTSSKLYEQ